MNIIFIGGVKFSRDLLESILENNWSISSVFSYDNSKKKFYSDFASFEEITTRFNVKHFKVDNINDKKNIEIIKEIKPDLILVMGWSQLLKNDILKIPKLGVIGSHPTELPKYRGRAPIPWSILKGLKESALTFFYIDEGTDDGDIIDQRKFKITDNDDATSIYNKIIEIGSNDGTFLKYIKDLELKNKLAILMGRGNINSEFDIRYQCVNMSKFPKNLT